MKRFAALLVLTAFSAVAAAQNAPAPAQPNNGGLIQHDQTSIEAQQPQPIQAPQQAVVGAPQPGQIGTPQSVNALDRQLMDLANLKQQSTVLQAQLDVETLKRDVATARGQSVGAANNTNTLPQLVGIVSGKDGVTAEFLSGDAILRARPGDWVSPQWRLTRVLSNGVELTKKGSRATHTLLFGANGTVKGSLSQFGSGAGTPPAAR